MLPLRGALPSLISRPPRQTARALLVGAGRDFKARRPSFTTIQDTQKARHSTRNELLAFPFALLTNLRSLSFHFDRFSSCLLPQVLRRTRGRLLRTSFSMTTCVSTCFLTCYFNSCGFYSSNSATVWARARLDKSTVRSLTVYLSRESE